MKYYNKTENKYYYGGSMTRKLSNGALWSGVPSEEQLSEWGYEKVEGPKRYVPPEEDKKRQRMAEIQAELQATDYLALKSFEGEDMSEHEGWKERRKALREEYRRLEGEL